jgi:hypothetical protein
MLNSDVFVFLDNAQYTKSLRQVTPEGEKRMVSYQSDTPIKTSQGRVLLTIPIRHNGYSPLNEIEIDYSQHWYKKHLLMIKSSYLHASNFPAVDASLKTLLPKKHSTLAHLNIATTLWALSLLLGIFQEGLTLDNVNTILARGDFRLKKIVLASTLGVRRPEGLQKGTQWTTAICTKLGATEYIYGGTAKNNYMDLDYYTSHGITPIMQDWKSKVYPQQFTRIPFLPNLSIVDLLCNVERKKALEIIL